MTETALAETLDGFAAVDEGEVEITFRPGGVRMLAEESYTKETA